MARRDLNELGELQRQIMEIVWEQERVSARDVQAAIEAINKRRYAYTSILSIMQKLEEYGWLKHKVEKRTNIYYATKSRNHEAMRSFKQLVKRVFHDDTRLLFQHLIDENEIGSEDLKVLHEMIQRKKDG